MPNMREQVLGGVSVAVGIQTMGQKPIQILLQLEVHETEGEGTEK